jgi:hypothetical protein
MTENPPAKVRVKYIGNYIGDTAGIGLTKPGDIIEVEAEYGTALAEGSSLFELAEDPPKKTSILKPKPKEAPKED